MASQKLDLHTSIYGMRYIYDIKFGMLQVREIEISLRKWSGMLLRTLV